LRRLQTYSTAWVLVHSTYALPLMHNLIYISAHLTGLQHCTNGLHCLAYQQDQG